MLRRRTGSGSWSDVTAGEFRDEVAALARGLIAAGIEPGDRVALMSRTRYEWTLIGGVRDSLPGLGPIWLIDPGTPAPGDAAGEDAGDAERAGAAHNGEPMSALNEAGAAVPDDRLDQRRASRRAGDLATIIYTSGTTGRPKGC